MKETLSLSISKTIVELDRFPQVQHAQVFGSLLVNPSQAKDVDLFIPCSALNFPINAYRPLLEPFAYGQPLYAMVDLFVKTSKALGVRDEMSRTFVPALPKTAADILASIKSNSMPWNEWRQSVELHPDVIAASPLPYRVYFAHPMTSYGSVSELRALKLLRSLFGEVINPSEKQYGALCGSDMNEWVKLAKRCDGVVFMGFDDGAISSGVDKEVSAVIGQGKPAFRISPSNGALEPVETWPGNAHVLSLEHTRSRVRGFLNQRSRDGKPGLPTRPDTGNLNWLNPPKGLKL